MTSARATASSSPSSSPVTAVRRERLREALPATAEALRRLRARDIASVDIDDYVSLRWLEWNGGSLRLTVVGDNICKQLSVRPS